MGRSFPFRLSAYAQRTQEGTKGRRWMPHSVSFTPVNLLPLSDCSVLSMCQYVSPVSHLTDTCPARSNGRTLIGALDIQSLSACSCCTSVTVHPSFLPSKTKSRPDQPPGSPITREPLNQEATFKISTNINVTFSSSINDRREYYRHT